MILYNYSLFGRAFEQAAKNTNCYIEADYFDTTSMLFFLTFYFFKKNIKNFLNINILCFSNKTEN